MILLKHSVRKLMFGITSITAYILTCLVLILLPGPNSMLCMAISAKYGYKKARFAILGTFLGNGTLLLLSALGLGVVLKQYPIFFNGLKILGGLYLAYLGIRLFKSCYLSWQSSRDNRHLIAKNEQLEYHVKAVNETHTQLFCKALLVALLNPKALLFFSAMMVQFIEADYPHTMLSFMILAGIFQTISLIYLNIISPLSQNISKFFVKYYYCRIIGQGLVGGLFISFAVKLWLAT